jgi:E3 ubiquitin-protein ligase RNF14
LYDRGNTRPDTHAQRLGGVQGDDIHGGPSGTPTYDRIEQEEEDFKVAQQIQKEEFELIRQQAAQKTRDCVVCGDPTPIIAFPALPNCEHEPQTCADCYRGWIESELNHKAWNEIKCPEHKCKVILQHSDVQQYAAPEIYERFDQLSARSVLNDDPNFRWCRAPNCQSGQIHISGIEGNIFRCIACGHRICVIHEDTWHEGETCEEYDYRSSGKKERDQKQQNEASVQAISKLTKKCPGQNCGWNIEKNDGCDHMTCSKCRYEFCWVCLASYTAIRKKGNTAHRESCKYHSSKIR